MPAAGPVGQGERADLGEMRADVGGPAEVERVAEREQADVADQEVEGAGEQRKAQRLHQEHRIGDRGRDHEHGEHHEEGDRLARHRTLARGFLQRVDDAFHHAALPNRPAGRISSTIAMMTKITVFDASGKNTLVSPSISPRAKPVTIAPMIEPIPPITTTANTTMMMSSPMSGLTL